VDVKWRTRVTCVATSTRSPPRQWTVRSPHRRRSFAPTRDKFQPIYSILEADAPGLYGPVMLAAFTAAMRAAAIVAGASDATSHVDTARGRHAEFSLALDEQVTAPSA
jgi:hypothetical protein